MAIQSSPKRHPTSPARVRVRHYLGAGYAEPEYGVAFLSDATVSLDAAVAAALVAQAPLTFTLEAGTAEKETT